MKLHSFQELVSRIIHLSTRDGKSIPISWSGTDVYTNQHMVNLPVLPAGTTLTPHQFSVWLGYTLHEGPGHQTHTDLGLSFEECEKRNDPQFSYLLNILEDIRIERADITLYPGDRRHLDAVHQFVDDQIPSDKCQAKDLLGLIYKHVYVNYRNLDTHRIQGDLPPGPIRDTLTRLPLCSSTQDCVNLTEELQRLIPKDEQEQPNSLPGSDSLNSFPQGARKDSIINPFEGNNPNENQDPSQNEQNRGGSRSEDREDSGDEKEKGGGGRESDDTFPNSDDSNNNQRQGDNGNHNTPSPNGEPASNTNHAIGDPKAWESLTEVKNLIQVLVKEITKANDDDGMKIHVPSSHSHTGSAIFPPIDISLDQIFIPSAENMPVFLQTRAELSPQILALKKMFRIHLQAKAKKSWLRGLDDGEELDKERLFAVGTGDNSIFKSHHTRRLTDTSVELMIDLSSSMQIDIARSAVIVLAEALSTIPQIKLSILGFTTNSRIAKGFNYNRPLPNLGRAQGMDILQFKSFSEPYLKCRGKLGAIDSSGMTPLGDAYGKALEHILPQTTPRRIIFLITDGKPQFAKGENHSDYLLMDRVHRRVKALGIETFGLGIGNVSGFLSSYVDKSLILTSISSLPRELMAVLKGVIR